MFSRRLTRRNFLKLAGVAGAVAGGAIVPGQIAQRILSASAVEDAPQLNPTVCEMCSVRCGVIAYVRNGALYKLEGNYRHSHSQGKICARGSAGVKLLYDPDRLQHPLKRGEDGVFRRISWEQAFDEIAAKLLQIRDRSGPQALAWVMGLRSSSLWDRQFMRAFGSPNLFSDFTTSHSSRTVACNLTVGEVPFSDFQNSKYVMLFGRNLGESIFNADLYALMEAKSRGAKVVVIDPRLSNTAAQAHEWVPIRPGTDGAMLLAMVNVVIKENLYNTPFVKRYVKGLDELKAYVADKTPKWASPICDVPAETIRRLAREFAEAKPSCVIDPGWHGGWGALYTNSLQTARAALTLNALMGNYGAKGGLLFPAKPNLGLFQPPETPPIQAARCDRSEDGAFPLAEASEGVIQLLPEVILSEEPYPVRAMMVNHFNPARSLPNTGKVVEALKKLELLVVIDTQMSETTELAHYILPESTYLERPGPISIASRTKPEIALPQPVVKPLYDTLPAETIITEIAKSAGLGNYLNFTPESVNQALIRTTGQSLDELSKQGVWQDKEVSLYGTPDFATPSGQVEVYSERLLKAGSDPLPAYQPTQTRPEGPDSFRLLHGKQAAHTGSSTQNNAWLHGLSEENALWINATRAAKLGIADCDWLEVASDVGMVRVKARVTEAIHPEAVYLAHGFGREVKRLRRASGKGANDNALIPDIAEPVTGAAALGEVIVRVKRAKVQEVSHA